MGKHGTSAEELWEDVCMRGLLQQLAILPTGFPIDFLGNLEGKIVSGKYAFVGCLVISQKSKCVASHPDCDHMTTGALRLARTLRIGYNYHLVNAVVTWTDCDQMIVG